MFTFADVFAGIGGFRLAAEQLGGTCIFTSEIKKNAIKVYSHNFGKVEPIDISRVDLKNCEKPDFVFAGWPCQSFSQAGRGLGFHDATRGTLFFHLINYLAETKAPYILLENVRGLIKHDNGKTLKIVLDNLADLDYTLDYKVLKASDYGLPQFRPRIYIVGFKGEGQFEWPKKRGLLMTMSHVLKGECDRDVGFTLREGGYGSPIDDRHNWDGYWVNKKEHRLMFEEAKMMQGFPLTFTLPESVSEGIGIKLLGNAVAVDVVRSVIRQLLFMRERQIGKKEARKTKRNKKAVEASQKNSYNR
jgi:DNA (cytosine-5)-methyltransferase 1